MSSPYDRLGEFQDLFMGDAWEQLRAPLTGAFGALGPDDVVVDVGAGTGVGTRVLTRWTPARVIAIEPSLTMRAALLTRIADDAEMTSRVSVLAGAVPDELDAVPGQIAGFVCAHMLGHLAPVERAATFARLARLLAPGGVGLTTLPRGTGGDHGADALEVGEEERHLGRHRYLARHLPSPGRADRRLGVPRPGRRPRRTTGAVRRDLGPAVDRRFVRRPARCRPGAHDRWPRPPRSQGGRMNRLLTAGALTLVAAASLAGCATKPVLSAHSDRLQVITTTGLLRDLVANVGGDRVDVASLVPDAGDPHSYEPTLRDARNVVYADVAFSNYALLEERNVIKTLDANLPDEAVSVSLAEESVKYAAELIPLVENVQLDTVWLGLRAHGDGSAYGADRTSEVLLSARAATGPGDVYAYLTGSFGDTDLYLDSSDGFDAATGYQDDTMSLPADAHTHLSWAFTEPGVYTLTMTAQVQVDDTSRPVDVDEQTITFAVGVDPSKAGVPDAVVLDESHADLTANLETGALEVRYDPEGGGEHTQLFYPADEVVIDVPAKALDEVPEGEQFSFLGRAGTEIYQLPQAVLGKHVHGEIDPHLWQNVRNAMAYVQLMRDTLIAADPEGAREYTANADAYLAELERLDAYVRDTIAQIPEPDRYLVTTHDAFGYLADAYHLEVAGFVVPNPAVEPSLADRRKLAETIRTLDVPAVFLEPNLAARASTLTEVAHDAGIDVCSIYGDAFSEDVTTYVQMMRFNADSLRRCLTS